MTRNERLERDVAALADDVPDAVRTDSCILGAKVAVEVMRQRGFRARAQPVRLRALNAIFEDLLAGEGKVATGEREDAWARAGALSVELGTKRLNPLNRPPDADAWDGHLVAIVEEKFLVDLTIEQVNRPQRGIEVRPHYCPLPTRGWGKRSDTEPFATRNNGCLLIYQAFDDKSYLRAPAWTAYEIRLSDTGDVMIRRRPGTR